MKSKPKILIVEDSRDMNRVLSERFKMEDFEVISAFDGESGLEMAQSKLPDVILLDIQMPKMNGDEVADKLRDHKDTKKIPIVFLTNLPEKSDIVEKYTDGGAVTFLVKVNCDLSDVVDQVKSKLQ